jgi:tetratricopeptide (TPR) repeat protein
LTATPFALVSIDTVSLWSRILVAGKAIVSYLGMMIVPLGLSPLYDHPGNNVSLLMPEYGGSLLLVMLITAGLFFIAGRTRILPVVWLYYLVTLLPVLGLAQNGPQEMADRFTYLPSLGPFLLAGVAAAWLWSRPARERIGVRCAIVLLGVFYFGLLSVLLIRQISVWKDSVVLWDYVIGNGYSRSPRSYNNRGMAYLERGVYDRAIADCTTALSIQPGYYRALYNRGKAYLAIGRPDLALEDLNGSIASSPEYADAYALRGEIRKARGDLGGAIADYTTALSLDPQLYEVYLYRGIALKDSGAFERAIDDYNRTIALVPDSPEAYNSRGAAYRHLGRMEQALADYNRSIALNPEFSLAYCNRGILHKQMKNYESAIADFRKAKALDPDLIKAYLELAECFQATGRIDLAREEYRAACSRKSAEACRALGEFR